MDREVVEQKLESLRRCLRHSLALTLALSQREREPSAVWLNMVTNQECI